MRMKKWLFFCCILLTYLSCQTKKDILVYGIIDNIELSYLGLGNNKKVIRYKYVYKGVKYSGEEVFYINIRNNYFVNDTIVVKVFKNNPADSKILGTKKKKKSYIKSFQLESRESKKSI